MTGSVLVISCVSDVSGAFGLGEVLEEISDAMPDVCDGPFAGFAQQGLELGEDHLDRVQVWAVGRQEEQLGADGAKCAKVAEKAYWGEKRAH